jgi:beta-lactamase superfamily II metal-dependent hydrolase
MIKLKMYPASEGDAFLVNFGDEDINIIIDMGLQNTYQNYMKPDLIKLNEQGKKIDLMVVTHVDDDHILGAVDFIKENGANGGIIKVQEVWHNSYRHLQFSKEEKPLDQDEFSTLKQIINQNMSVSTKSGLSDVSINKGITLAGLLYGYNYSWNDKFDGKAVLKQSNVIEISPDLTIRIISPNTKKLGTLAAKWKAKLESEKYNFTLNDDEVFDDAFEQYMRMPEFFSETKDISRNEDRFTFDELVSLEGKDRSATNGSSIAFIMEYNSQKLLFLGDAHEDIIYDELASLKDSGYELDFEIVKISHHGSNNNISNRLLELVSSKRFLISTNGKHHHPDLGSIAKIVASDQKTEIITNYTHDKLDVFKSTLVKNQNKTKFITTNEIIVE